MDKCDEFFKKARNLHLNAMEEEKCTQILFQKIQKKPVRSAGEACPTEYMADIDPLFIEKALTLRLSAEESSNSEKRVLAFMKEHPINMEKALLKKEAPSRSGFLSSILSLRYRPIFAAVLLLVLGTGSLSYAAEFALPGDALYPIKIHLNEEVQIHLAMSAEAKVAATAKRAARRMEEAEKLAANGRLTPAVNTQLRIAFNAQAEESRQKIAAIAKSGDHALATRLNVQAEETLRGHTTALVALNEKSTANSAAKNDLDLLLHTVEQATDETIAQNASINGQIAMDIAPEAMMMKTQPDVSSDTHPIILKQMDTPPAEPPIAGRAMKQDTVSVEENAKLRFEESSTASPMALFSAPSTMMLLKATNSGATASSLTGSSSISIKSAANTPVQIDIQKDGKINVHVDTDSKDERTLGAH